MDIKVIITLMRPYQYIKNIFILLPLFFAVKITDKEYLLSALFAFVAFSLIASGVYILNDYFDIEVDKLHPTKRFRPLAFGSITKSQAIFLMVLLFLIGFVISAILSLKILGIVVLYVILNIAYTLYLKHIAILDITIIAIGFVLRLFVGAFATNIELSMWIVVMTFLLALFMALAKRRDDVLIYLDTGKKLRSVVDGYNLQFLDTAMAIMASVVIVAYTIYTTSDTVVKRLHSDYLYLTSLFVILGILRYLQIVFVLKDSGSPTKIILKDRFIQCTIIGWIISFAWIIY